MTSLGEALSIAHACAFEWCRAVGGIEWKSNRSGERGISPMRMEGYAGSLGFHGKAWARSHMEPPMEEEGMVDDEVVEAMQASSVGQIACGITA